MFADPVVTNPFVADGIVPEKYGNRTLLEYRARLFSVRPSSRTAPTPPGDHMDIITPAGSTPDAVRRSEPHPLSAPRAPDIREGEDALHALATSLDLTSLGPLHPSFYGIMRVVPPAYKRRSAIALRQYELKREGRHENDDYNYHETDNTNPSNPSAATTTPAAAAGVTTLSTLKSTITPLLLDFLRFVRLTLFSNLFRPLGLVRSADKGREPEPSLLSWHWEDDLLAVVTGSDLDRICAFHFKTGEWELAGDRHVSLSNMQCVAFRPFAGRVVALGGRHGVTLLERQTLHKLEGQTDICSLDWSPDGLWLAAASAADGRVKVWDVSTRTCRDLGKGALVKFNPNKDMRLLLVADGTGQTFYIWNLRTWARERWGSLSGPVVAATWTPDGSTLLFSTLGLSCIHILSLSSDRHSDSTITNYEMTALPREGPGGTPILLELDPTSERLAVIYEVPAEETPDIESSPLVRDDPHRRFAVALYATQFRPSFNITPIGYISGPIESGPPVAIKFKPVAVGTAGATLACMWRSGQITFTHLFFNPSRK